jgi:flavin-dependent dehydrogenase
VAGALTLRSGSKIAVIGGGPAGSFFVHFARKRAEKKAADLSIVIFDGKDFLERGPRGCNLCAGVIAASLEQKLQEEGLFLPEPRIINRIEGYSLHAGKEVLRLSRVQNAKKAIATVFRGNGPRFSRFPHIISFDDFLLSWAQDRGARIISQPVWGIRLPKNQDGSITLFYGNRHSPQSYEADLVIGAFGVNTFLLKLVQELGFGYRPPATLTTFQAEFRLGLEEAKKRFGRDIHVYLLRSKTVRYATIIPKGDYVTVSVVGKKAATPELVRDFFGLEEIRRLFPPAKPHCFCYPKIAVSAAQNPFYHRLVLIGDASFSRHYKNGIESAFMTARLAADAAFGRGVDAASFGRAFYRPAQKLIVRDNLYGRALFRLNDVLASSSLLTQAHFSLAKREGHAVAPEKLRRILWSMFTGDISYRNIFVMVFDIRLQISLFLNTIRLLLRKVKILLDHSS